MRTINFVSMLVVLSLLSPAQAKYPEESKPSEGEALMKELREKLNISYQFKKGTRVGNDERRSICRADENRFSEIQHSLVNPLLETIEKGNFNQLEKYFTKKARTEISLAEEKPQFDRDGIRIFRWEKSQKFMSLKDYLKTFEKIDSADLETFDYRIDQDWRAENYSYDRMNAIMELRVNGLNKIHQRKSDRYQLIADIRAFQKTWLIDSITVLKGESVISNRAPAFSEVTKETNLHAVPVHLRREAIRRGGYSVAVTDMNNDSVPDLFFGTGGEAENLIGSKDMIGHLTFSRSQKDLPQGSFVKSSVFADFDNDGDQDAVLVRYVQDHEHDDELVFFRNNGEGKFQYEPLLNKASIDKRWAMPAAVGDFNADGFLDLYVGYPGKKDFTTFIMPGSEKEGVLPHGLFFNSKGKAFTNVTKSVISDHTIEGAGNLYPHSALAYDYDHNRTTDLVVIDDRDNLSPMYRNNGKTFDQVADKIGLGNSGYGMSVAIGDYNNDGLMDIAMTNVNLVGEVRFRASCDRNWNVRPDPIAKGLRLFRNEGRGRFTEVTDNADFGWPGAATGGIVFTDYNNDGFEDIYVTNGLWSGNKKGNELDSFWATANIQNTVLSNSLKYQTNGTQSLVMNLLIHYQPEKSIHPSLGGFQRNKLYRNNGDGTFTDVAFLENIDAIADGYAVVTMDMNNDGKQEILLRNADPGTAANKFPSAQLYLNTLKNENNFITLTLKGSDSSKDAIGTEIEARFADQKVVRQHLANNGPQQSQRIVHIGIGSAEKADLTIRWPNGKVEIMKDVRPGFHHYEEPAARPRISAK